MREISTEKVRDLIREMCMEANYSLPEETEGAICAAAERERSKLGRQILGQLKENLEIARSENIPICQDTGMAIVFLEVGQDVHFSGGGLDTAVHEGVRRGYEDGYLRKSVVGDPLLRKNTGDNTPAVIHTEIVPGEKVRITVAPKGFGSENKSRIFMLKPSDGREGVKEAVIHTVRAAGASACPPLTVGVGIGGSFEMCALLAKRALTKGSGDHLKISGKSDPVTPGKPCGEIRAPWIEELETELLDEINKSGIGPAGLGGSVTALAVNICAYPTHIAGLPVAVNLCCHVNRHVTREI